jgi:hypothetical protein
MIYVFTCEKCEESREEVKQLKDMPQDGSLRCECGSRMWRDYGKEQRSVTIPSDQIYGHKASLAMECDRDQVAENMQFDREHGLGGTEYRVTDDGLGAAPVYTSRSHQRRYEESRGCWNKDGGYGDSQKR